MPYEVYSIQAPVEELPLDWQQCQVLVDTLCIPHVWDIRVKTSSNGSRIFQEQCVKCGKGGKSCKQKELSPHQVQYAKPFDAEAQETCNRNERQFLNDLDTQRRTRINAKWWQWYNRYLESPVWKRKRQLVFMRSGGICEACRQEQATEVHHLTYDRVGKEPLFDLAAVCHACHQLLG